MCKQVAVGIPTGSGKSSVEEDKERVGRGWNGEAMGQGWVNWA